jgi:hypothetical protein
MTTNKNSTVGIKSGTALLINISRRFKIHAKISGLPNVVPSAFGIGCWHGWSREAYYL